jgi:putative ABC transport system permease protein
MSRFIVYMVWRETRGSWRHFVYFLVCIAVGVGALVSVSLFAAHVDRAVTKEARGLLGGDLEIRASRALSAKALAVLSEVSARGIETTHVSELVAMAAHTEGSAEPGHSTQIVELKAVEAAYPFYGKLALEPPQPLDSLLSPTGETCGTTPCLGAVVQEGLLYKMRLSIGDRIKIGSATFTLTGVVRMEPDRMANAFSLGPRVFVSQEGLREADLVKPGSRVRERYLLKLLPDAALEPLRGELRGRLSGDSVRVTGYRDAQPQLKQFLEQLSRYLGLIGLTALFIGGLGVAMSVHAFVQEKMKTIVILKTLGADSITIMQVYVGQTLGLGLLGSLAGMASGVLLQRILPPLVTDVFDSEILVQLGVSLDLSTVSIMPLMKGGLLGLLATLLFTLWPLLGVRTIKPAAMFRREVDIPGGTATTPCWWRRLGLNDGLKVATASGLLVGFAGLSIWQAGSWKIGILFLGGVLIAALMLTVCAGGLIRGVARLPRLRSLTLRYAVGNVGRPGGQTVGIIVAIGLSMTLIVTVSLVEQALLRQVGETRPVDAPTFFFIDIQADQRESFAQLIHRQAGGTRPELTPLVRSRLRAVNGNPVTPEEEHEPEDRRDEGKDKEERRRQWYLSREYVLTYLDHLPKGNEITKGRWWDADREREKPLLSIEEEAAKAMGLELGSTVEFDIQGATVTAEVSSVRKVDWGSFSTNFYMILSPGSLEGAPLSYVGTIHVSPALEVTVQQSVVAAFPNVSAIHVGDVLENFGRVLDRLSLAIRTVALFCLIAGGLVMAAALAATRYRRLYESVIFKALGATRGLIARTFAAEYAVIGAVAGIVAVALSNALSWLILTYVFDLSWMLQPSVLLSGLSLTILLTLAVGCLSTFQLLRQRPLAILRHE